MRHVSVLVLLLASSACDGSYPRDPEHTSERVARSQALRAGVTEHPPWVTRAPDSAAAGAEAELVERFAASMGVRVEWYWGQQEALLSALERFELDLVVGGLKRDTRFSKHVGMSDPWHVERWGIGIPSAMQAPATLRGLTIELAPESMLITKLQKAGAEARPTASWRRSSSALAAPLHILQERKLNVIDAELDEQELVIATPPGENRWLGQLQRFLAREAPALERIAQAAWR